MQTPILMKLVDDRLPIDDKSYTLSAVITFHTRLNSTERHHVVPPPVLQILGIIFITPSFSPAW